MGRTQSQKLSLKLNDDDVQLQLQISLVADGSFNPEIKQRHVKESSLVLFCIDIDLPMNIR